jgi:hypothetical protein
VGLLNPHLDDAAFAEVWADRLTSDAAGPAHSAERHLRACAECRAKFTAFSHWLESTRADAMAEADEAFAADRLLAQQSQIVRRLEALEHPAKVIAFPRFATPVSTQPNRRQRWIAAAAAAGLVAGVALGQVFEFSRSQPTSDAPQIASTEPASAPAARPVPVAATTSDESFLYVNETRPSQARVPESLQYLNAITPSARDYDPR